jgi:putative flippase GtrA
LVTNLNIVLASSIGALIGAFVNYLLNYHFTFESDKRHSEALGKFFTIASLGFVLNGLLVALLAQKFAIHYLLAQIITTGIVLIWTFFGNHFWTFREANVS